MTNNQPQTPNPKPQTPNDKIDELLSEFQYFGVNLGLERISVLLADLGNPQAVVPVLHVAGTNGKGSVCAYLSSILTAAGYRVGRYTSPHLVSWCERICLNDRPIDPESLYNALQQVKSAIRADDPTPTLFEVVTAAAWLYFQQQEVDVAVMEVGLGGRLDATNVIDRPLVSIITSIGWDHWQNLGDTLGKIAGEKAGILKAGCPAVVGQLPPEAQAVVAGRIAELGCPAVWVEPATYTVPHSQACYRGFEYPLPLLGEAQLMNSAIALAAVQLLQQQGWQIDDAAVRRGMAAAKWLGRLQWVRWRDRDLLIDGAHNAASARVLRQYADTLQKPIVWVMGMLSTKDHRGIFEAVLRSGDTPQESLRDRLYLVPVPDRSSANPAELATLAKSICPDLAECYCFSLLEKALEVAMSASDFQPILCGSLYLVGHFLRQEEWK
ncbi:MAG TPA: bifunctional folylpolyglutamate synthase/dihydrofolate synthase [Oscillatoriales cyanobacterium M59_W2019_021]|nr:MAG: bifunctional folylpolyglutamate synthase/dihydrofolate synthase [Cyanobacteria bacterium J055]HIK30151.1 bifunctional folylpolyglutamate synthase/dihydrofolate synthase [Oscillatoriales cyanobacterium M4454_W2019_049]HIK52155.1 bifunctional folylpolyglutamate synthase/dihydrofolate synthase [Oscillatoriales cyanobacterium M59_W2019_021]